MANQAPESQDSSATWHWLICQSLQCYLQEPGRRVQEGGEGSSQVDSPDTGTDGGRTVSQAAAAAAADAPDVSFVAPFPPAYSSNSSATLHFINVHSNGTFSNEDTLNQPTAPSECILLSTPLLLSSPYQPSTPSQSPTSPPVFAWPCSSPLLLSSLPDGRHQLWVRLVGEQRTGGSWAAFSWTVDTTPPSTSISWANDSVPGVTSSLSPTVRVAGREEEGGSGVVRLECKLEAMMGGGGAGGGGEGGAGGEGGGEGRGGIIGGTSTWQPCVGSFPPVPNTPPTNHSTDSSTSQLTSDITLASLLPSPANTLPDGAYAFSAALPDGVYSLSARAVDAAGNADLNPPSVQIVVSAWAISLAGVERREEAGSEGGSEGVESGVNGHAGSAVEADTAAGTYTPSRNLSASFPTVAIACEGRCAAMLPPPFAWEPSFSQQGRSLTTGMTQPSSPSAAPSPFPSPSPSPSSSSQFASPLPSPSPASTTLESLVPPSATGNGGFKVLVSRGGDVRRGEELKGGSLNGSVTAAPSPAAVEDTPVVFNVLSDVVSFTFPPALPPQPDSHPPADPGEGLGFQSRPALAWPLLMVGFTLPDPCDPNSGNAACADMQAWRAEPESTVTPRAGALAPAAAPVAAATPVPSPPPPLRAAATVVVVQGFSMHEVLSSAINASLPASPAITILFHPHTTPTPTSPSPSPPSQSSPPPPSSSLHQHSNPSVDGWQVLDARLLWQQQQPCVATFSAPFPGLYAVAVQETMRVAGSGNQDPSNTLTSAPPTTETSSPAASSKAWVIALAVSLGVGALVVAVGLAVFFVRVRGRSKVSPHLRK
ncbi:unnamed protein product [Closterium sp. NIES-53]